MAGSRRLIAVCFKVVGVDLWRERLGGDGPDAGCIFFHGDGFGEAVKSKRDLCGCSILVGERDAAVGVDVRRAEMRGSLSGERDRRGKCKEQAEFAGNAGREEIHTRQFSREARGYAWLTAHNKGNGLSLWFRLYRRSPECGQVTLLNALLGQKLAIVTHKPQTTRTRIHGVLEVPLKKKAKGEAGHPAAQVVLVDTPGMHKPDTQLDRRMMQEVHDALESRDAVLFIVDVTHRLPEGEDRERSSLRRDGDVCGGG